jgi:hypothetical protein
MKLRYAGARSSRRPLSKSWHERGAPRENWRAKSESERDCEKNQQTATVLNVAFIRH